MRKIILFAIAFAISSFVFSQEIDTQKDVKQLNVSSNVSSTNTLKTGTIKERTLQSMKQKKAKYLEINKVEFRTKNNIPSSFPKYIYTGDMYKDTKAMDITIKQWIKDNEQEYKKIKDAINF